MLALGISYQVCTEEYGGPCVGAKYPQRGKVFEDNVHPLHYSKGNCKTMDCINYSFPSFYFCDAVTFLCSLVHQLDGSKSSWDQDRRESRNMWMSSSSLPSSPNHHPPPPSPTVTVSSPFLPLSPFLSRAKNVLPASLCFPSKATC